MWGDKLIVCHFFAQVPCGGGDPGQRGAIDEYFWELADQGCAESARKSINVQGVLTGIGQSGLVLPPLEGKSLFSRNVPLNPLSENMGIRCRRSSS